MFETLVANLSADVVRTEMLEGQEHWVCPLVMLTEGVHTGTHGPGYYPVEEMSNDPTIWNHMPIVNYHPENGSARTPDFLNARKVGVVLNARWDGKLRAEAWINKSLAGKVDPRIVSAIDNKTVTEVSTGLFLNQDKTPGEWNGEKYDWVARDHKPDHLAILMDKVGACSVAKGAGLLQLNEQKQPLASNEASYSDISRQVRNALHQKFDKPGYYWDGYLEDVYRDFFVYSMGGKYFRQDYSVSNDVVTFNGDAVQVVCVTEYRTVTENVYVGNASGTFTSFQGKLIMNRQERVNTMIKNGGWPETDREWLMTQDDARLDKLEKMGPNGTNPQQTNNQQNPQTPATPPVSPPTPTPTPQPTGTMTWSELVANADPMTKDMLGEMASVFNEARAVLIDKILKAPGNVFTKEQLAVTPTNNLKAIAALVPNPGSVGGIPIPGVMPGAFNFPAPNYAGAAGAPVGNAAGGGTQVAAMIIPALEFGNGQKN
jgi:hypothetical protein